MYPSIYTDCSHCWMVSNSHSCQWKAANEIHRQPEVMEVMEPETDFVFFFHCWSALSHLPPSLPLLPFQGALVSLWTTDLMRSGSPMGSLIIGLWCTEKGWTFPHKAWLHHAFFHVNKDIHSFLICVLLGIIPFRLAVRWILARKERRQSDRVASPSVQN